MVPVDVPPPAVVPVPVPVDVPPPDLVVLVGLAVVAVLAVVVVVEALVPLAVLDVPLDLLVVLAVLEVLDAVEVAAEAVVVMVPLTLPPVPDVVLVEVLAVLVVGAVAATLDVAATVTTGAVLAATVVVVAVVAGGAAASVVVLAAAAVVSVSPRVISPITAVVFIWVASAVEAAPPPPDPHAVSVRHRAIEVTATAPDLGRRRSTSGSDAASESVTCFRRRSTIRNTRLSHWDTDSADEAELITGYRPVSDYPFDGRKSTDRGRHQQLTDFGDNKTRAKHDWITRIL